MYFVTDLKAKVFWGFMYLSYGYLCLSRPRLLFHECPMEAPSKRQAFLFKLIALHFIELLMSIWSPIFQE